MNVKETLRAGQKPTKTQIKELEAAEKMPITYTAIAPRLADKELAEFKQVNAENRKKIPCTLRISKNPLSGGNRLARGIPPLWRGCLKMLRTIQKF